MKQIRHKKLQQPLVSVIVPVYNVERYIRECVSSLLGQTLEEIELIFVDDASPDGSVRIIQEMTVGCDHVKIIREPENIGVGASRNHGLAAARGEYLKIIDSDDFLDANALKDLYVEASRSDADIVFHDAYLYQGNRDKTIFVNPEISRDLKSMSGHAAWWYLFKRSIITQHPEIRFPEGAHPHEDTTFSFMLYTYSESFRYLPKPYIYYRQHGDMVSNLGNKKNPDKHRKSSAACLIALHRFYRSLDKNLAIERRRAYYRLADYFWNSASLELIPFTIGWSLMKRRIFKVFYQNEITKSNNRIIKVMKIPIFHAKK